MRATTAKATASTLTKFCLPMKLLLIPAIDLKPTVPWTAKDTVGKRHETKIFGVRRSNMPSTDSITETRRSKYLSRVASNKGKPLFRTSADTLRAVPGRLFHV
jgi:hypothetical protein